jgi:hypothetical protein
LIPIADRFPAGSFRRGLVCALLSLALVGSDLPRAGERGAGSDPLETLSRAFRTGDPRVIKPLLKGEDKILVSARSLGLATGFYSGDQVYFLVEDLLRSRDTLRFQFSPPVGSPPTANRTTATARWIYRTARTREVTAEITFTLIRKEGVWCLKEIRDPR